LLSHICSIWILTCRPCSQGVNCKLLQWIFYSQVFGGNYDYIYISHKLITLLEFSCPGLIKRFSRKKPLQTEPHCKKSFQWPNWTVIFCFVLLLILTLNLPICPQERPVCYLISNILILLCENIAMRLLFLGTLYRKEATFKKNN